MNHAVCSFYLQSPHSFSRLILQIPRVLVILSSCGVPFHKILYCGQVFLVYSSSSMCNDLKLYIQGFPPPAPSAINSIFCLSSWNLESHLLHSFSPSSCLGSDRQLGLPCTSCKLPCLSSSNRDYFMFSRVDWMWQNSYYVWAECLWADPKWVGVESFGAFYVQPQPKPAQCSW